MGYIVKISAGGARTQSIILPNKSRVSAYVKRNPVGNIRTTIEVINTVTKGVITGSKAKFYNPKRF